MLFAPSTLFSCENIYFVFAYSVLKETFFLVSQINLSEHMEINSHYFYKTSTKSIHNNLYFATFDKIIPIIFIIGVFITISIIHLFEAIIVL